MQHLPSRRPAAATLCTLAVLTFAVSPVTSRSGARVIEPQRGEQPVSQRVFLGVLRSDAILMPFASFDGKKWSTPWPSNIGGGLMGGPTDIPVNLAAVPKDWWDDAPPSRWRLYTGDQQPLKPVTPIAPVTLFVGVMRRLGLRTDFPPGRLPSTPRELPFPKEGVVIGSDADVEVRSIAAVSRLTAEWSKLPASIREDIDKAEERTLSAINANTDWKHPFDRKARSQVTPELEAWYSTALAEAGALVSYVELVKKYPLLPEDNGCGLETFVSGWLHHKDGSARPKTALKAVVTYCDRATASYMLPFGQIQLRNRTHWIFQMSGQDHEWYEVVEATPGRIRFVAEYEAGGIPAGLRKMR
jgi:hypothetical protein